MLIYLKQISASVHTSNDLNWEYTNDFYRASYIRAIDVPCIEGHWKGLLISGGSTRFLQSNACCKFRN